MIDDHSVPGITLPPGDANTFFIAILGFGSGCEEENAFSQSCALMWFSWCAFGCMFVIAFEGEGNNAQIVHLVRLFASEGDLPLQLIHHIHSKMKQYLLFLASRITQHFNCCFLFVLQAVTGVQLCEVGVVARPVAVRRGVVPKRCLG